MNEKIAKFFQHNGLSTSFQEELLEVLHEYENDSLLLQEHIYMLCHQFSFSEADELVKVVLEDETVIISPSKGHEDISRRLDGFRDVSLLGLGGMGEVRRVYDEDLDCFVAMKLLHEHLKDSAIHVAHFQNEAKI